MRDRIYINLKYRDILKEFDSNNTLGFHIADQKDIFLIAVALGLSNPKDINGTKDGLFLLTRLKTSDNALLSTITLGNLTNEKDVDKFANNEINYLEAEKCAETGFGVLNKKVQDSCGNEELLQTRLISELDLLYEKNVKSN